MSELDGDDAFDRVLDRLIESEKRAATDREAARGSVNAIQLLQRDLNNANSDLTTAKMKLEQYSGSDSAFIELYDAVGDAIHTLESSAPELASQLQAKMEAAKKFIDPIPF